MNTKRRIAAAAVGLALTAADAGYATYVDPDQID
jgi:hypothetical protein